MAERQEMAESKIRYLLPRADGTSTGMVYTAETRAEVTKPYPVVLHDGRLELDKYASPGDQLAHQGEFL